MNITPRTIVEPILRAVAVITVFWLVGNVVAAIFGSNLDNTTWQGSAWAVFFGALTGGLLYGGYYLYERRSG